MKRFPKTRAGWLGALALLVSLATASPVLANEQVTTGQDVLVAKDAVHQTLKLEGTVLKIAAGTRIYDGDGRAISFAEIPDPHTEVLQVEYTGTKKGAVVNATRIVVQQAPQ